MKKCTHLSAGLSVPDMMAHSAWLKCNTCALWYPASGEVTHISDADFYIDGVSVVRYPPADELTANMVQA